MGSSYPFDRVWHHSRGIVFSPKRPDAFPNPATGKLMFHTSAATSQAAAVSAADAISNTLSPDRNTQQRPGTESYESDIEDAASFTTAPEHNADNALPTESAPAREPPTNPPEQPAVQKDYVPLTKPPTTDLEFKLPETAFTTAKAAPEGSMESFWSYALYRASPDASAAPGAEERKVKVHYCKSKHTMERVCREYFADEEILGFDLEWQPDANRLSGPRKNISLIQMASPSRIALFHVALFPKSKGSGGAAGDSPDDFVSETFRRIMEDPDVSKVGVAIKGDGTRLRNYLGVAVRGLFELSHLYKLVKYSASGEVGLINKMGVSLAKQAEECLGLPLFKGHDVRSSDWSQPLNMAQLVYSASDAYAGLQLYHVLEGRRKALDPTPPRPYYAELNQPIRLARGISVEKDDTVDDTAEHDKDTAVAAPAPESPFLKSASETVHVEREGKDKPEPKTPIPKRANTPKSPRRLQSGDARVLAAEDQVISYQLRHSYVRATQANLRSYYIWHANQGLVPGEIAKILRDPPLKTNTVVGYILEAIRHEKLPFDAKRLRNEVLHHLPRDALEKKYPEIVRKVYEADTAAYVRT